MVERKIPITLNCGLDLVGEVLYGKWKIRLLFFINEGNKRPSELQRKIPDATPLLNLGEWADANQERLRAVIERKILKAAGDK